MAQHIVKCLYCGKDFDINKESFIKPNKMRYAHTACAEKKEQEKSKEEKDLEALEKYILFILEEPSISARVRKQIKDYHEKNQYSYSGMLKTLIWFYEVKGNSPKKANGGIGIIGYVYDDACQYYYNLYLNKLANSEKNIQEYSIPVKEIVITSPQKTKRIPKLFLIEDGDSD